MTLSEGEALLAWINTFPEVQPLNITNFIDCRDCKGVALLWNAVHPNKINVEALLTPNGPTDWLTALKNLREVDKVISPVLTEKGLKEKVDITKLARGNEEELVKFISPLVIIAASSPLKREVVTRIKSLSPQNRKVIQTIIQNFAQKKKEASAAKSSTIATTPQSNPSSSSSSPEKKAPENPSPQSNDESKPLTPRDATKAQDSNSKPAEEQQENQSEQQSQSSQQPASQLQPPSNQEKPETPRQQQPQSQPKPDQSQPKHDQSQSKPDQSQSTQKQQPMKTEDFEIRVREAESQIENLKKEIESRDAQIVQLQEQANKKFKKADQSKAQYIDQTERMTADIVNENNQNNERLEQLRHDDQIAQNELIAMKARIDALQGVAQKTMADHQKRRDLFNTIKKLEDAITESAYLDSQIQHLQENLKKINGPENAKKSSNSNSILEDENEVLSPQQMDEEIEKIKEEITTSIQLAEKYGNATSESIAPAENDNHETVTELATRITQMEIELAVIKDEVQSGRSGIPPDLEKEQKELSKVIKKLMKRKEELLNDMKLREQLRQDMRRVQQTMVEQREEVEKELEKQTDDINARNVDLTNWLSFSSSFDTWRRSSTFLTDLRQSYL